MPAKRKVDNFDPNKSDSADTDFDPSQARASPKKSRKSTKRSSTGQKKRIKKSRYKGSDVSDDGVSDSLLEDSFGDPSESEEEPIEMNEATGRAVRKATKKVQTYEESSGDDIEEEPVVGDIDDDSDEEVITRGKNNKRSRAAVSDDIESEEDTRRKKPKTKVVVLKLNTQPTSSTGRALRGRKASAELLSAGLPLTTRRSTRAHTEEGDQPIALSDSGHHIIREGRSPEPIGRRGTRGGKGLKQPASTIKEEIHESSSHEQGGESSAKPMEIAGSDDQDEADAAIEDEEDNEPDAEDSTDELAKPDEEEAQVPPPADDEDEDEDDMPVARPGRTRGSRAGIVAEEEVEEVQDSSAAQNTGRRLTRGSKSKQKSGADASSDFDPGEENLSDDDMSDGANKKSKAKDDDSDTSPVRRGRRTTQAKSKSSSRRRASPGSDADEVLDKDEMLDELEELRPERRRRARDDSRIAYESRPGRQRKPVDYSIKPMDQIYAQDEDAEDAAPTPSRRPNRGRNGASQAWERNLFTTYGPFGGGGGPAPAISGPWGTGAAGGVDSDSSDDETMQRPSNVGGNTGMTPTSAVPPGLLPGMGQTNNAETIAGLSGTPANLGKIKSQKALADADPLGVDQNVDFTKIGGLEGHIDQLKEMVQMPLLYPELFLKFHVTPPRGVLFHGPPGTGKTLLARALAAQVGSGGRKITFYMRKGADALSKWVGEAERQLRLLFEEARKTQPSIIFFDEIDGLAPVRSSKQEQIHASIVSTLLALMDGMDGRGQVIVIGATNRPDNIDPALRRPGRFDREFYFPLPDIDGRKSIINIHTKDWGIDDAFKTSLAHITKGYGGADLRALCTEAALNAIQRTYPQIYSSNDKLKVDSDKIKVTAKDFMLSVKKMIPSSERSTSSGAAPLPKTVEPLLRDQLSQIERILDGLIPIKKKTTALQEAMYEQYDDEDQGFGRETLQQEFEKSRVFRPRLLIGGEPGMGQSYLGGAILNHFEGLHVQSFDLPTIYSDSARSPEAAIVQLFAEVKRHKPSVIYLPGIETWYHTLSDAVITTFLGLLRAIPPTDPVLVLGITDSPPEKVSQDLLRDLFGFSRNNRFMISRPSKQHRKEFFSTIIEYVKKAPKDFPEPLNRKKRKLEVLELAPPPPPKEPTKEEIKAQKKKDHQLLNLLKVSIQPIMDQIQRKYRKFRTPVILQHQIQYLLDELDPDYVRPDILPFRPFEFGKDKDGVPGLRETATGKFFYNLETTTIEERLSNGYYARPKDFLADIRSLAKDAKHIGDKERTLKANELLTNVEVDIASIEANHVFADCENVYQRQLQRTKEREEKHKRRKLDGELVFDPIVRSDIAGSGLGSDQQSSGPLMLGEAIPGRRPPVLAPLVHTPSGLSNGFSAEAGHAHESNGTSVPSHAGQDVQMGDTDEQNVSQGMLPPHQHSMTSGPSGTRPNTQISQRSFFQAISHDTPVKDIPNDASTTTSGKKTSDGWSTQATNGVTNQHSSSPVERGGDSQLPDTQRNTQNDSSSEEWMHSQAHALARGTLGQTITSQTPSSGSQTSQNPAVPPFTSGPHMPTSKSHPSFANLLNDSPVEPSSTQMSSQKDFIIDDYFVDDLLKRLVEGSSGCSIEQLEQINRELMETLWRLRGEYNRNQVITALVQMFNDTITDIEEMQKVLNASQPTPTNSQLHA
ncbi:AAA-domain-containing protein [Mollisia scopiformis]|uniref:AAA-domain-containing protein n=1 Tax=Mollisia scopiformis TaxID=149040 RepID=A0A194XMB0_MOLSC|nr:AAA-domain-containing protein [Mollisia scopiformis]KUJ20907.1 AAA-domain-containing protein [Mollisia scopiformis]